MVSGELAARAIRTTAVGVRSWRRDTAGLAITKSAPSCGIRCGFSDTCSPIAAESRQLIDGAHREQAVARPDARLRRWVRARTGTCGAGYCRARLIFYFRYVRDCLSSKPLRGRARRHRDLSGVQHDGRIRSPNRASAAARRVRRASRRAGDCTARCRSTQAVDALVDYEAIPDDVDSMIGTAGLRRHDDHAARSRRSRTSTTRASGGCSAWCTAIVRCRRR